MYKRKRVASLIIVFAMILQMFSTFSTTANAKDIGGIVTKASLKTSQGDNVDHLDQFSIVQLDLEFALPNGKVEKGDKTVIKIPPQLRLLDNQSFDVKTPDGQTIAKADIDAKAKTITLTYTEYPQKHSDVRGKLFVGVGVDTSVLKQEGKVELKIEVNGETKIIGKPDYKIVGDNPNEQFAKYAWQTSPNGTELQYRLRVNSKAENFKNVVVGDELKSNGLEYDKGSFRIYKGKWKYENKNFVLEGEKDVTEQYRAKIKFTSGNRGFSIDFGDINNGEGYKVAYSARVTKYQPQNGEKVYNNAWMKSNDKYIRKTEQFIAYQFAGGSGEGYNFSIRIFKKNENGQGLEGAEFKVVRDVSGDVVGTIKTDSYGYGRIDGLLKDNYTIIETNPPKGYAKSNEVIKVAPSDFKIKGIEAFKEFVNKKIEKTYVEGRKIWKDGDDQDGIRPKEIKIALYANDKKIKEKTVKPNNDGNWNYKFDDLDKYDDGGKLINYTVKEEPVQGYTTTYEKTYCGYNITNEHKPETVEVKGDKKWLDDNDKDKKRPNEITIGLYADHVKIQETKATKANNWEFKFENLPKYKKGKKIEYTVKEEPVEGYTSSIKKISDNVYQILNTITGKVSIPVNKTWVGPKQNKAVVKLFANGVEKQRVELNEANNWSHTFSNLPKYDDQGKKIAYTLKEEPIQNYDSNITGSAESGFTVKNTNNEKVKVPVEKTWVGPKQKSVTVRLYADGVEKQHVELSAANNWKHEFTNLPKYNDNGTLIKYTVKEDKIAGYNTEITGDANSGYKIKNVNVEKTQIPVEKTWVGPKTNKVTVRLFADGVEKQHVELSAANNWKHIFKDLPKYNDNGSEIKYTVKEDKVANYDTDITGNAKDGFKIKNSNNEKVKVPVEKTWVGPKQSKVTVRLFADGVEKQRVELSEANNWKHEFKDLPKYRADGSLINYTVKEDAVANYDTDITGNAKDGFKIKNSNNEKVKVPVEKTWVGPKQSKVTVRLFADGVEKQKVELSEANNWKHEFKDLPKYNADGSEIKYTVKEDKVANYDTDITGNAKDGFKIKNSNNEKVKVPVEKTWVGPKQSKVTVRLFADGVEKQHVELSAANNWKHEFTNLPKYNADGSEIKYTVKEDKVANYDTDITGNAKDGFKIKNSNNEKVKVPVEKTWVGPKQSKVTVRLFADGVEKQRVELSEANNWKHEFKDLPKYRADGSLINYTVKEDAVANYDTDITGNAKDGFKIKNSNNEKVKVPVEKTWVGPKQSKVTVRLFADGVEKQYVELSEANNWKHEFKDLPKYNADGSEIKYTVKEDAVANYDTDITGNAKDGFKIKNSNNEKVKVPVEKTWVGPKQSKVTVRLFADGVEKQHVELSAANNWKHEFTNLPKYNADGSEIKYTVKEDAVANYDTDITGNAKDGFKIKNSNNEKVKVPVEKTWVGPKQKSVTVRLYADGVEKQHIELSEANSWKHEFKDLPKYNADGSEIKYTVKEDKVANYDTDITGNAKDGFKIKNSNNEKVKVPVEKTWVGPKQKSVTVRLFADGVEKQKVELSAANNWKHEFKDLPKYNADGSEIKYTVKEDKVANYDTDITGNAKDGFKIKNSNNEKVKVPVEKTWIGPKQSKVTVRLFADGVEKQKVELSAANNWKHEFKDLPKYNADGSEIKYTVKEDKVANYDTDITGNAKDGFKIKNSNNEKVKVPLEKTWVGPKQSKVTVRLFADGVEKQKVELSEANSWKHEFKDLPKYNADGSEIKYTVKEDKVANYDTDITGNAKDGFKIKNTNVEKTKISVNKTWVGPKADKAVIKLLADGVEKERVTLSEANNWKHTFENLPKYDSKTGKEIKYEIKEEPIKNYRSDITGNAKDGFTVKNTNVEKVKIPVVKKWIGKELDSVTINLYANGKKIDEVKLSKSNGWKHTFENLPKYDLKTGKEIKYTIDENKVTGYKTEITGDATKGFTVINKEIPPAKTGDDSSNGIYGGLMGLALAGILGAGYVGRRRKEM